VFPAALVTLSKGLGNFDTGELALDIFQATRHFRRHLIKFLAAASGMKGSLEAHSVKLLVVTKVSAGLQIMFLLGIPQTDPPLLSGGPFVGCLTANS